MIPFMHITPLITMMTIVNTTRWSLERIVGIILHAIVFMTEKCKGRFAVGIFTRGNRSLN
jgi:hypothetical protein